jgi:signal transduction histidine kinase
VLKSNPSLAARGALIFIAVYAGIFLIVLVLISRASLSPDGDGHHAGPTVALNLAAGELQVKDGLVFFSSDGGFGRLAARNPHIWLIVESGNRRYSFGSPTGEARRLFGHYSGILDSGKFHVRDLQLPLSDSIVRRRQTALGDTVLAAGGLDPSTLTVGDGLRYFLSAGLMPLLVLGGVGLAAMMLALPLMTAGIRRVTQEASSIRADQPTRRIDPRRVPRELLPLVHGFNAALDRLAGELIRRRRFIADVAHELRTPLAITSLQVESLPDTDEKHDLQRVVARMSHLVCQMLDVERLSLAEQQQRSPIDLVVLARDVVAEMAPMALAAGYDIAVEAPPAPVIVEGDTHALGRALANLIGNAVAHGEGTGEIKVRVESWRTIDVIDEGPGVPLSIRERVFEPFCRERWDRDGCGLGLHLTREIMRAHGGNACLLPSRRGAAFRLDFAKPPPTGQPDHAP